MTGRRIPVDDLEALQHILTNTEALLLDFDGPICSIFAGFQAKDVATQLLSALTERGHIEIPTDTANSSDPFDVFRYAANLGLTEAEFIENKLRALEIEATRSAEPTVGAHELIKLWSASGRRLAIVSNNSAAAVDAYLHTHELAAHVDNISARTFADPSFLKPNPHLIFAAVEQIGTQVGACTMIGDSLSDISAAKAATVTSVGYANKFGKEKSFTVAAPDLIITSMTIANYVLDSGH